MYIYIYIYIYVYVTGPAKRVQWAHKIGLFFPTLLIDNL